jgi:hypothetical protein
MTRMLDREPSLVVAIENPTVRDGVRAASLQ